MGVEKILKKKIKKFEERFPDTNLEQELIPLSGEETKIKKKSKR